MATFSVRFLRCKVSFGDAQELRERLLADGHTADDSADVVIVNTCCVTHVLSTSRNGAARTARSHERVYATGYGANLAAAAKEEGILVA
jgi:tRNA A37 methylthiotransferase MiaB